jgi:transcription elongation factor GreA
MNIKINYLSKEKFDQLTEELAYLKGTRRKEIAGDLEYARSLGDLSENAEYHQARELQGKIESRIFELENVLKNVEIVKPHHSDVVNVGATVLVKKKGDTTERTFHIVGGEEADTGEGKISLDSPLGQAMIGKKKKEAFTFTTPSGKEITYVIVKID